MPSRCTTHSVIVSERLFALRAPGAARNFQSSGSGSTSVASRPAVALCASAMQPPSVRTASQATSPYTTRAGSLMEPNFLRLKHLHHNYLIRAPPCCGYNRPILPLLSRAHPQPTPRQCALLSTVSRSVCGLVCWPGCPNRSWPLNLRVPSQLRVFPRLRYAVA